MKVIALDYAQFTITLVDMKHRYASLEDSIPFTYLLDKKEDNIILSFTDSGKKEVSFNLISPVEQLTLSVFNQDSLKKMSEAEHRISSDGYIKYKSEDI